MAAETSMVERVADAIESARCPHREGPFGGYDYGYRNATPPKDGRYVIRDFRSPASPDWGKWIHQTDDVNEHDALLLKMTRHHIARAAIEAMREPTESMVDAAGPALKAYGRWGYDVRDDRRREYIAMIDAALNAGRN